MWPRHFESVDYLMGQSMLTWPLQWNTLYTLVCPRRTNRKSPGWFEQNKTMLRKLVDTRNATHDA